MDANTRVTSGTGKAKSEVLTPPGVTDGAFGSCGEIGPDWRLSAASSGVETLVVSWVRVTLSISFRCTAIPSLIA